MESLGKIKIIGTSHISPESIAKIKRIIKEEMPDCVAVELDPGRLQGLLRKETVSLKSIKYIGMRNFITAKIFSAIQRHLGKKTGVMPGEEMLTAVEMARETKADLALIDQDMLTTLERIKSIPFSEKAKLFLSFFKKSDSEEKIDLRKVPMDKTVEIVIEELKKISPSLYRVLVEERDAHMARNLFELRKKYKKIVAVVGVGHKKGILRNLTIFEMKNKELDRKVLQYKYRGMAY